MQSITLSQAAIEFGGTLMYPDCRFNGVSTDSRSLLRGELFVALEGERFDGHQFLPELAEKASGFVVRKPLKDVVAPQWVVPDTTVALGQLARLCRDQFNGVLLAITGSSGKTTVKEMLAAILAQEGAVLATKGNLNNHIGVPLTLFSLCQNHRFAVVEMGASGPGEIAYLCGLALPDIVLVNNVLPAHVAGFGSLEGVAEAKGEIYQGVSAAGTAVINLDEPFSADWLPHSNARHTLTYSIARPDADIRATNIQQDQMGRCQFELIAPSGIVAIQLALSGRHNVSNALAAAACATAAGATPKQIAAGLLQLEPVAGRLSRHETDAGAIVLDDTYNANPGSMKAAIDTLMAISLPSAETEKVFVMGDMGELGPDEIQQHRELGRYAAEKGVARMLATGTLSAHAVDAFSEQVSLREGGQSAQFFEDKNTLAEQLKASLDSAQVILVKGSRSAAMEDVVRAITESGRP